MGEIQVHVSPTEMDGDVISVYEPGPSLEPSPSNVTATLPTRFRDPIVNGDMEPS